MLNTLSVVYKGSKCLVKLHLSNEIKHVDIYLKLQLLENPRKKLGESLGSALTT